MKEKRPTTKVTGLFSFSGGGDTRSRPQGRGTGRAAINPQPIFLQAAKKEKGPITYVTDPLIFSWRSGRDSTILQDGKIGRRSHAKPPVGAVSLHSK
ncbi:MAG: hypothetical protein ACNI3A_18775 [Desulfovibrio sp.]|uniref:hypothetical protein n=1 Tax=Desulfovibrio sp. 7SRBS1 TaxID=3378064 RepID=UPI003B4112F7